MIEATVITYTADCDGCGDDAEWTAIQRPIGNSLSVACARCGGANRAVADVVPLPPGPAPAMLPTSAAWTRAHRETA